MKCKDQNNRSAILLSYYFLPLVAGKKSKIAAEKCRASIFDRRSENEPWCSNMTSHSFLLAVCVCPKPFLSEVLIIGWCCIYSWRVKSVYQKSFGCTFGFYRLRCFLVIMMLSMSNENCKMGRTRTNFFIASNERTPGLFAPLARRYKLVYSSNYSSILNPVDENKYEHLIVLILLRSPSMLDSPVHLIGI